MEWRTVLSVRPKIAELVFQLYGRSVHPELFEVYHTQRVARGGYEVVAQITSAGHLVTWKHADLELLLTEVATSAHQPLPQHRRLVSHALKGSHSDQVQCRGGVRYEFEFSLEPVDQKTFWTYQEEIQLAGTRQGMLHRFQSSGRFGLGAISYVNLESRDRSLRVQAFHTFPDDQAIVKSQSVFQLPDLESAS